MNKNAGILVVDRNLKMIFVAAFFLILMSVAPAFGVSATAHESSADLQPEWSIPNTNIDYTVTICHVIDGGDSVDEVRIYNN
ncbi:MAG: hypothetical protein KAR23_02540, partial [Candidatus Aenigmarchaeota archaeon]|nr:hypothetical protein [Candidatus Aenigmarchaeota archaeon]